jgi:phosphatidylglycerophosphate synthase
VLTTRYKASLNRCLEPLAAALARTGVSPAALTLAGPILTLAACWWFVRTAAILPFCLLMGLIGCLDVLDGAVARVGGRVTKFGAYLDALCDRYVDAMVVLAAAQVTGYWALSLIALAGGLLVSYAKARAAMEVPISNLEWPDLMERAERSALFLGGLAASVLLPWQPLGRDLFWWTLLLLAILTHLTVVQRILRARRLIKQREA